MTLGAHRGLLRHVVHGLLQPLNVIRCVAQDLRIDVKKGRLDVESLPDAMLDIEKSIDVLASQLGQLRAFARSAPAGAVADIRVAQACEGAVSRVRALFPDLQIDEAYGADLRARASAEDLEQIVFELLDNAAHAQQEAGRGDAPIRLEAVAGEARAVIRVRDSGGGIAVDDRAKVFAPFFSGRMGATGLGLPLADLLVEGLGGEVKLVSASEEGSVFEVLLPEPSADEGA